MKRRIAQTVLAALAVLAPTSPPAAAAHAFGRVGVFADATGAECNITDVAGLVTVEVVLVDSEGSAQVSFALEEAPGVAMSVAYEALHYELTLGTLHDGIRVLFGGCETSPIHLATITYVGTGTTTACEPIRIVPHPALGTVEIYDCALHTDTAEAGGIALVSDDGACGCSVSVEPSTWGRIKAFYLTGAGEPH